MDISPEVPVRFQRRLDPGTRGMVRSHSFTMNCKNMRAVPTNRRNGTYTMRLLEGATLVTRCGLQLSVSTIPPVKRGFFGGAPLNGTRAGEKSRQVTDEESTSDEFPAPR